MPHQVIGVAWMAEKEKSRLKGGLLGDDMGLGKVSHFPSPPPYSGLTSCFDRLFRCGNVIVVFFAESKCLIGSH